MGNAVSEKDIQALARNWHERLARLVASSGREPHQIAEGLGVEVSDVESWLSGEDSCDADQVLPLCRIIKGKLSDQEALMFLTLGHVDKEALCG